MCVCVPVLFVFLRFDDDCDSVYMRGRMCATWADDRVWCNSHSRARTSRPQAKTRPGTLQCTAGGFKEDLARGTRKEVAGACCEPRESSRPVAVVALKPIQFEQRHHKVAHLRFRGRELLNHDKDTHYCLHASQYKRWHVRNHFLQGRYPVAQGTCIETLALTRSPWHLWRKRPVGTIEMPVSNEKQNQAIKLACTFGTFSSVQVVRCASTEVTSIA